MFSICLICEVGCSDLIFLKKENWESKQKIKTLSSKAYFLLRYCWSVWIRYEFLFIQFLLLK
jgi:hypothetical protein